MGTFGAKGLIIGPSSTSFLPASLISTGNTEGHNTAITEAVNMGSLILRPFVCPEPITATAIAVANKSSAYQPVMFTGAGVMNRVNCWPLGIGLFVAIIIRNFDSGFNTTPYYLNSST